MRHREPHADRPLPAGARTGILKPRGRTRARPPATAPTLTGAAGELGAVIVE